MELDFVKTMHSHGNFESNISVKSILCKYTLTFNHHNTSDVYWIF